MLLRSFLTPFLKGVARALSIELEEEYLQIEQKVAVFDEIVHNVPAENSTSNIFSRWSQASDDLEFEFDRMLNLQ